MQEREWQVTTKEKAQAIFKGDAGAKKMPSSQNAEKLDSEPADLEVYQSA